MELPSVLDGNICDSFVDLFEKRTDLHVKGQISSGINTDKKDDTEITIDNFLFSDNEWKKPLKKLVSSLDFSINKYINLHSLEKQIGIDAIAKWQSEPKANIQKFLPGQGYKSWHCEIGDKQASNRVLVWMVYLNTISDKGGTEFYFQNKITKAEQGKIVIWPPYWTHFHRSQVSFTETKYIITGWFEFI